jgi:hypothetical protein
MVVVAANAEYEHSVMVVTVTHIITFGRPVSVFQPCQGNKAHIQILFIPMQRTGMFP